MPPAHAALATRRHTALDTGQDSLDRVLTAKLTLYPFRVIFQEDEPILRRFVRWTARTLNDRLIGYATSLWVAAAVVASALVASGHGVGNVPAFVFLAVVAVIAERASVRLSTTSSIEQSISILPSLFAAVLLGPLAAMAVSALSMLSDIRGHAERPLLRWSIYTCSRALTGASVGLVAALVSNMGASRLTQLGLAALAGAATAETLDILFAAITFRLRGSGRMGEVFRTSVAPALAAVPIYAPFVMVLAFSFEELSGWTLPLFFVPALAAQRLFALYQGQLQLTDDLVSANDRLERANLSFATALVATLDARDRYTAGHSATVAIYARDIARRMELGDDMEQLAHLCGLVHDIGKVGLPPGFLEKAGPLSLEERRQMERHPEIGENILGKVDDYAEIARIVRHHHERYDGNGYPDRLRGEQIPLISRILAVADAYDAMTSDRPYRQAMPSRVARLRLAQAVGSQFDTTVVAAFEAILATETEQYRLGGCVRSVDREKWLVAAAGL
jgi:putative nucleotidyltransferase with HDIG domain